MASPSLLWGGEMYSLATQQTTAPASWEIYALLPVMIIFMVLMMLMKIISAAMNPEYIRELRPIVEKAAMAKALPAGGR